MMLINSKKRLAMEKVLERKLEEQPAIAHDAKEDKEGPRLAAPIEKRIRLSCDISQARHRQLKVHAAERGKSVVEVVEGLIDLHCSRK